MLQFIFLPKRPHPVEDVKIAMLWACVWELVVLIQALDAAAMSDKWIKVCYTTGPCWQGWEVDWITVNSRRKANDISIRAL